MSRYRVMVVDDDPDVRFVVRGLLGLELETVEAQNGLDALEKVERYEPDLLLVDVKMPVMNGFQCCRSIRKHEEFHDIPVFFLSGATSEPVRQEATESGASGFFEKPFDTASLINDIRAHFTERRTPPRLKTFSIRELEHIDATPLSAADAEPGAAPASTGEDTNPAAPPAPSGDPRKRRVFGRAKAEPAPEAPPAAVEVPAAEDPFAAPPPPLAAEAAPADEAPAAPEAPAARTSTSGTKVPWAIAKDVPSEPLPDRPQPVPASSARASRAPWAIAKDTEAPESPAARNSGTKVPWAISKDTDLRDEAPKPRVSRESVPVPKIEATPAAPPPAPLPPPVQPAIPATAQAPAPVPPSAVPPGYVPAGYVPVPPGYVPAPPGYVPAGYVPAPPGYVPVGFVPAQPPPPAAPKAPEPSAEEVLRQRRMKGLGGVKKSADESPLRPRVLVIIEQPEALNACAEGLRHLAEFLPLEDPVEAVEIIARYTPDIVVAGIRTAKYSGLELGQMLRSNARLAHTEILYVQGMNTTAAELMAAQRLAGNAPLPSPLTGASIRTAVQYVMHKPGFLVREKKLDYGVYVKEILQVANQERARLQKVMEREAFARKTLGIAQFMANEFKGKG